MITQALMALRPKAEWVLRGSDYSGLEWLDKVQTKPTEAEVNTEIARLEAEHIATQYRRDRVKEYPQIGDQLDDLFRLGAFSADMQAQLQAVKDKYPKGVI